MTPQNATGKVEKTAALLRKTALWAKGRPQAGNCAVVVICQKIRAYSPAFTNHRGATERRAETGYLYSVNFRSSYPHPIIPNPRETKTLFLSWFFYFIVYPPSAIRTWPVIRLDASDAKNRHGPAISSGWPNRPSGIASNHVSMSSSSTNCESFKTDPS